MQLYELNPHVRYARRQIPPSKPRRTSYVCYDARLFYIEGTQGAVYVGADCYELSSGSAVYLPPLTEYRLVLSPCEGAHVLTLNFDLVSTYAHITRSLGVSLPQALDRARAPVYPIPTCLSAPLVRQASTVAPYVRSCVDAFATQPAFYREMSGAYVRLCLLALLSDTHGYSPLCTAVRRLVAERYGDAALTNEALAAELRYHPQYINRVVRRELGMSLRSYLIEYRLERARQLLEIGEDSVSAVAGAVGFASVSYFTKRFRERYGVPPREHRRALRL